MAIATFTKQVKLTYILLRENVSIGKLISFMFLHLYKMHTRGFLHAAVLDT